jgi:hypothetical protein
MKYQLGLIFTVLFFFNGFSQKKLAEFAEGEIYIKVKSQFGKKIKSTERFRQD